MTQEHSPYTDSAGVPWEGRSFTDNQFKDDDGSADPELIDIICRFQMNEVSLAAVFERFAKARLLVPLVAMLGEAGTNEAGLKVDKSAELSIVSVRTPDGQEGLPVFSSVTAMQNWNASARPVPNNGRAIALAAASEGNTRIVLDPGSETELVIRRPAIAAIAQGLEWAAPETNNLVVEELTQILSDSEIVESFSLSSGDSNSRLQGQELVITLFLEPDVSQRDLESMERDFFDALATNQKFVELVDSVAVKYLPAS